MSRRFPDCSHYPRRYFTVFRGCCFVFVACCGCGRTREPLRWIVAHIHRSVDRWALSLAVCRRRSSLERTQSSFIPPLVPCTRRLRVKTQDPRHVVRKVVNRRPILLPKLKHPDISVFPPVISLAIARMAQGTTTKKIPPLLSRSSPKTQSPFQLPPCTQVPG